MAFARGKERIHHRRMLGGFVVSGKQMILSTKRYGPDFILYPIVVDL
jgi:hypothetical protein